MRPPKVYNLAEDIAAGVDEAGRGPLAGPVVACAVILTAFQADILLAEGLGDSKKVPEKKRLHLYRMMGDMGVDMCAACASHERIDRDNILSATLWAMGVAVRGLSVRPQLVVVDGTRTIPGLDIEQHAVPKADATDARVMAASVAAKVLRDAVMIALHRVYPVYGFDVHKGYPTKQHRAAIFEHGPSPVHRTTFRWRSP